MLVRLQGALRSMSSSVRFDRGDFGGGMAISPKRRTGICYSQFVGLVIRKQSKDKQGTIHVNRFQFKTDILSTTDISGDTMGGADEQSLRNSHTL